MVDHSPCSQGQECLPAAKRVKYFSESVDEVVHTKKEACVASLKADGVACPHLDPMVNSLISPTHISQRLLDIEQRLCTGLMSIDYSPSGVQYVYNPLEYASEPHSNFVHKYGNGPKRILFLGMNPGPFGMAQNGVPFGDVSHVKDWLGIVGQVSKPAHEHPKRPILGLESTRNEVSGTRFWNLMKTLAETPDNFFQHCYVHNYCPLCYMTESGKNVTPSSMKVGLREPLQRLCDDSLTEVVSLLGVTTVVGVGGYAQQRGRCALKEFSEWNVEVKVITHPSPINPAANKDWIALATKQLRELGLEKDIRGSGESKDE